MSKTSIIFTGDIGFDKYMDGRGADKNLFSKELLSFFDSADHTVANVEGAVIDPQDAASFVAGRQCFHAMHPDAVNKLKEITADDVLYTYEMLLDPNQLNVKATQIANATSITIVNAAAYFAGECSWEDVGMKKIDDYTIEITNVEPTTQLNVTRTIGVSTIVCKELYKSLLGDDGTWTGYGMTADQYVSSGAFILKEWIPDAKFVLERNPDFVFADKIKIEGITFIAIPDAQTALELFVKGEIDAVDISYEHWENYAEDPAYITTTMTL